jgi:hypothetical protein
MAKVFEVAGLQVEICLDWTSVEAAYQYIITRGVDEIVGCAGGYETEVECEQDARFCAEVIYQEGEQNV